MKKALVFLILSFPAFSFGDVISLKSGGEIEGKVKRYEDSKFVVEFSSGGKTAISSEQVQTVKFSEPSSKTVTFEDTLTLRKSDGSTYVLKGRTKSYEDNKFTVVSSSGGQTAFSIKQIQSITFAKGREDALGIKTKARSSVKKERGHRLDMRGDKALCNLFYECPYLVTLGFDEKDKKRGVKQAIVISSNIRQKFGERREQPHTKLLCKYDGNGNIVETVQHDFSTGYNERENEYFMKTCQNTPSLDGDEWHPCQGVIRGKDVPLSLLCKDAPPLGGVLHSK